MLGYARFVTTIPHMSFWVATLMETWHWRELRLPHPIWRGERNLYTQCYAKETQFFRESWHWNIHHKFSRQACDINWTSVGWYTLYFDMYFRLFLEWCLSLVSQYPSAKAFWIAFRLCSNAHVLEHTPLDPPVGLYDTQASMWAPHRLGDFFASSFAAGAQAGISSDISWASKRGVGRFSFPHLCSVALGCHCEGPCLSKPQNSPPEFFLLVFRVFSCVEVLFELSSRWLSRCFLSVSRVDGSWMPGSLP